MLNAPAFTISEATSTDPWVCAAEKNAKATQCINSQMSLAPGASTTFQISATPGAGWNKGNLMQNCVSVNFPAGTMVDPASRTCGTAKLDPFNVKVIKSGDTSCTPGADCHFTLTLYNPGPIDHDAPVTISDKLKVGTAPITSISPPLPLGGPPHVYNLTIRLPAGATTYSNCATVGPLQNADANAELGSSVASTSCVTTAMRPAATPPLATLQVTKTGDATCMETGPCNFHIQITNVGTAPYQGTFAFSDDLHNGPANVISMNPALCGARMLLPMTCTAGPVALPTGGAIGVDMAVQVPPRAGRGLTNCVTVTPIQAGLANGNQVHPSSACALAPGAMTGFSMALLLPQTTATSATNCASVAIVPLGLTVDGITPLPQPDTACAKVALLPLVGTGGINGIGAQPGTPPTQPPALQTSPQLGTPPASPASGGQGNTPAGNAPNSQLSLVKTGDATCAAGSTCNFTITILDPRPGSYEGPLALIDQLAGNAQDHNPGSVRIAAIQPPIPCKVQPNQIPFTCFSDGNAGIANGLPQSFRFTVVIPPDFPDQTLTNCAMQDSGSDVPLAELGPLDTTRLAGKSCATVVITPPVNAPNPNHPPVCFSNMAPDANSNCGCPANTFWDGTRCGPSGGGINEVEAQPGMVPACPNGTAGAYPDCRPVPLSPPRGAIRQTPILKCPAGTIGIYPNCRPSPKTQELQRCPIGMTGTPPTCACPTGTHLSRSGRSCLPDARPQTQRTGPSCPPDATGRYPDCRCPRGSRYSRPSNQGMTLNILSSPGGSNFPMGGQFPIGFPGRHNPFPGQGDSNDIGSQPGRPQCRPGEHHSPALRRCVANNTTTTPAPTPAPAPGGNITDEPTFGGCPGCGAGGTEVIH